MPGKVKRHEAASFRCQRINFREIESAVHHNNGKYAVLQGSSSFDKSVKFRITEG